MKSIVKWFKEILSSMGNAFVHPFKDNEPPSIDPQPYRDDPYKNKGIA